MVKIEASNEDLADATLVRPIAQSWLILEKMTSQICAKSPTIAGANRTVGAKGAEKAVGRARNASPKLRAGMGRLARSATRWAVFECLSTDFNEAHRHRLRACLFVSFRMSLAGLVCLN